MAKWTNDYGLPRIFANAIKADPYDPGRPEGCDRYVTATSLVKPPQIIHLAKQHADEITVDIADRIFSLWGQAGHVILERGGDENTIIEQRLYAEHDGWTIGGQLDAYDMLSKRISDNKFTSVWSVIGGLKWEWRWQLNVLGWLARRNNLEVQSLSIYAHLKDWSASKAKFERDYPVLPFKEVSVPVMEDLQVESWLSQRLADLEQDPPRPCTDPERWARNHIRVMRKGRKRALRRFDSQAEAELWIAAQDYAHELEIKVDDSKYIRCEQYCHVSDFCQQFQLDKQSQESDGT